MSGRALRLGLGALVAAGGTAAMLALSHVPYAAGAADAAGIHLAWRVRPVRVEQCRRPSAAELAALPVHMRRTEICEGRILPYALTVVVDGDTVVRDSIRAAGARSDRPLYVNRELSVPPGTHRVTVRFARATPPDLDPATAATPADLVLTAALVLGAGDVALITYDAERQILIGRGYGFTDSSFAPADSLRPGRR